MSKTGAKTKSRAKVNFVYSFYDKFNLSESYVSLFLGILVVILTVGIFMGFVKSKKPETLNPVKPEVISQELQKAKEAKESSYLVQPGDTLWSIAEQKYNSGFAWTDIAKENHITDPSNIEVGTKLILTTTDKIIASSTMAENSQDVPQPPPSTAITTETYTVNKGDNLWDIAVRAYGDGYRWVDIAKANNLANPNLIFSGNVFVIPR